MAAFANGIVVRGKGWPHHRRIDAARFMVYSINVNTRAFVADRPHVMVRLEAADGDVSDVLRTGCGLRGRSTSYSEPS